VHLLLLPGATAVQLSGTVPDTNNLPSQGAGQKTKQKSAVEQGPKSGSTTVTEEKGPARAASSPACQHHEF